MDITDIAELLNANDEGAFLDVAKFNGHTIGASRISGTSPYWEMHPSTDEFFYILDGVFKLELLLETGTEHVEIHAGSVGVVPKGIWHRPSSPDGTAFIYMTPGETLHSDKDDPRVEDTDA